VVSVPAPTAVYREGIIPMVLVYRRNLTPEPSPEIADTVSLIREAQRATAICLETWLRHPIASFGQRLAAAMNSEKELFDLVFNSNAFEPPPLSKSNPDLIIPKASPKPSVWPSGARKLTDQQRREIVARREAGEIITDIAQSYNVHHSTVSRLSHPRPKHSNRRRGFI
jgi:Helix-turn-helix domain